MNYEQYENLVFLANEIHRKTISQDNYILIADWTLFDDEEG